MPTAVAAVLAALLVLALALVPRAEAYIYWANKDTAALPSGMIGRANLDGTEVNEQFIPRVGRPGWDAPFPSLLT